MKKVKPFENKKIKIVQGKKNRPKGKLKVKRSKAETDLAEM